MNAAKEFLSSGFRTVFEHKTYTKTTLGKTCQRARLGIFRQLPLADLSNGPWIRSCVRAGYLPTLVVRKLVVHKTWQYNVFLSFSFHFGDKIGVIPSSKLIVRHWIHTWRPISTLTPLTQWKSETLSTAIGCAHRYTMYDLIDMFIFWLNIM